MKVVEWETERMMGLKIQDGPIEIQGRAAFSASGPDTTDITTWARFPDIDDSMADKIRLLMERSAATIKQLIESET